jgi:hypothetical protein
MSRSNAAEKVAPELAPAEVEGRDRAIEVGWQGRLRPQLALLGAVVTLTAPLAISPVALALALTLRNPGSDRWLQLGSGCTLAALVLAQGLVSAMKRTRMPLPGSFSWWTGFHKLTALVILVALAVHTRGRWGANLNTALLCAVAGIIFVAQAGHVMKAWLNQRGFGSSGLLGRLDRTANSEDGLLHHAGLALHIVLATVVVVLGLFHVLGVLYF